MSHNFKPVTAYACGQVTIMAAAVEEHMKKFGGRPPIMFVLHEASAKALDDEVRELSGGVERGTYMGRFFQRFMGVPCALCPNADPQCEDHVIDAAGAHNPL